MDHDRTEPAVREAGEISREELRSRLADPALVVVNVLPREAWRGGRIPRSISLPLADIPDKARRVLPVLGQEIVVYCGSAT
jgi:rhodanese-related sulfurtransferase